MTFTIKKVDRDDQKAITEIMCENWGNETIAVHGELFTAESLDGIKAVRGNELIGFLHYQVRGEECEIITLISLQERQGIGSALIAEAESIARENHCRKISLTTTNDNLYALGFYQRRGFNLAALFPNQIEISRRLKPAIPRVGMGNIPLRDEIKLEKALD